MSRTDLYSWTFSSSIRGFHIYKTSWEPYENEILTAKKESDNLYDVNAISIIAANNKIFGHAPCELASVLTHCLNHSGVITVSVTNPKYRHCEIAGGLEIIANYKLSGKIDLVLKAEKVLLDKLQH